MTSRDSSGRWPAAAIAIMSDDKWLDRLLALARETLALTEGWDPAKYDDEMLRESIRGYIGVVTETLEGRTDEKRRLFLDVVVPAFVEAGQSSESLISATATYQVLVANELVAAIPESSRRETLAWFANFAGKYVSEVCASASRSSK